MPYGICPEFLGTNAALMDDEQGLFKGSAIWTRPLDRIEFIFRTPYPDSKLESSIGGKGNQWTHLDGIYDLHDKSTTTELHQAFGVSLMHLTKGSPYLDMIQRGRMGFQSRKLWQIILDAIRIQNLGKSEQKLEEPTEQDVGFLNEHLTGGVWVFDTHRKIMTLLNQENYPYFRNQQDYSHRPAELPEFSDSQLTLQ